MAESQQIRHPKNAIQACLSLPVSKTLVVLLFAQPCILLICFLVKYSSHAHYRGLLGLFLLVAIVLSLFTVIWTAGDSADLTDLKHGFAAGDKGVVGLRQGKLRLVISTVILSLVMYLSGYFVLVEPGGHQDMMGEPPWRLEGFYGIGVGGSACRLAYGPVQYVDERLRKRSWFEWGSMSEEEIQRYLKGHYNTQRIEDL